MMIDRSMFLHPPGERAFGTVAQPLVAQATDALREAFGGSTVGWPDLLLCEARASSAIESEYADESVRLHCEGLVNYIQRRVSLNSMLDLHKAIMLGQEHAQPGNLRSVRVRVGRYIAPDPALVPSYMDELYTDLALERGLSVERAAWAHVQFETIHPFADGNGRIGRGLVNQILRCPVTLSEYILAHQMEYYALLDSGSWDDWLPWFAQGLIEQAEACLSDLNRVDDE